MWQSPYPACKFSNFATDKQYPYVDIRVIDEESHLYYLNSRYYDPETGRFISPDVLLILDETKGQINGLNLYSYCGGNPIMRVDHNGHAWYDVFAWIGVGLFVAALTVVTLGAAGIAIGGIAGGIVMGAAIGTLALGTAGAAIGAIGGMIYDAVKGNVLAQVSGHGQKLDLE